MPFISNPEMSRKLMQAAEAADANESFEQKVELSALMNESGLASPRTFEFEGIRPFKNTDPEGGFATPLVVSVLHEQATEIKGRTTAILVEPFSFIDIQRSLLLTAPPLYKTDFASIPPILQGIDPPFGRHAKAAVMHDWLYALGEEGDESGRAMADGVFEDALEELQVNRGRINRFVKAVRLLGSGAYGRASEWRFADPVSGKPLDPAPYDKANQRRLSIRPLTPSLLRTIAQGPTPGA